LSEALTPEAPETDSAVTSVEDQAPEDGTAVADGSAGDGDEWKRRFDGLMASSQRRESELRNQLEALESRITSQETPDVADEAVLAKLEALEERARKAERKANLKEVLDRYPAAKPLADLIVGDTLEDMENVAAAIAQRLPSLGQSQEPEEPEAPADGDAEPAAPEAPVIGGGAAAPTEPSNHEAVTAALESGSWADYWAAKTGAAASANLG
jgi:hypothetical protein